MNKFFSSVILFSGLAALTLTTCKKSTVESQLSDDMYPPVYVTIAGHIEDVAAYAQCNTYTDYREKLLIFAETFASTGASFNLQIEYEFFLGVTRCETEAMTSETNGCNIINYLASHYGFEIDPHQEGGVEEGQDNYADVRFLGKTVTDSISENVGGLVWDDPQQFARLAQGEPGWMYPDFTWYPEVLTLAVSKDHHYGDFSRDDIASGIWNPKGANDNFWIHDPEERMIYVGPGEHSNWGQNQQYLTTPEFVETLSDKLEEGTIDRHKMYTVTLAVPQSIIFDTDRHDELLALLEELEPFIQSGKAEYVTYSEAVHIWKTEYEEQPNIFYRSSIDSPK
ncbi:MAG: hypothetical protein R6V04_13525 [bacterium]